jgi:GDPmannose 4,6-dehydratase
MHKSVMITGITGQDGSILCDMYLDQGYLVYGLKRRNSSNSLGNAAHLEDRIEIAEADICDTSSITSLVKSVKPEIFINCAAQSHVGTSFSQPMTTADITGMGVLNCLEAIRQTNKDCKFLQLSSSEMFGGANEEAYNEESVFDPKSPYAAAKCFGHHITKVYRESYDMFASTSICFNHEEPGRRGPNFVTRKITLGIADILAGKSKVLKLGNLNARRDWGMASDYCEGMIDILNHSKPDDFVLATGETHSVLEFCKIAFKHSGLGDYKQWVKIDPKLYRPNEVNVLIGDASKAKNVLGWEPKTSFETLVKKMVNFDVAESIRETAKKETYINESPLDLPKI